VLAIGSGLVSRLEGSSTILAIGLLGSSTVPVIELG
jgi:hypothetical protein